MRHSDRVLIVLIKNRGEWDLARTKGYYRLPVTHGPRDVTATWIAFYQPGDFGDERWGVHRYARIRDVHTVRRIDLFPDEPDHPRAQNHYYAIAFEPPLRLARPIVSAHGRRFIWTDTTWWRFTSAATLDELFSPDPLPAAVRDRVLVGVVPRPSDFELAAKERWYRIPAQLVERWETPGHLAFYFGQAFGNDSGLIRYYAPVQHADVVKRIDLFPNEPSHPRAQQDYVRVYVDAMQTRPNPIRSRRPRRLVLLPTTWERFSQATDLNDLYAGDEAEETFYGRLTAEGMRPERQYYVRGTNAYYFTDFAFPCTKRNVAVDIDGQPVGDECGVSLPRKSPEMAVVDGWDALRLSRFDLARRPEESIGRIRELVDRSGGMVTD